MADVQLIRVPTSDIASQWTPVGSANNFENVDEYPIPTDTEGDLTAHYNHTSTANEVDDFGFAAINLPSSALNITLKIVLRARRENSPINHPSIYARIVAGGTQDLTNQSLSTSFATYVMDGTWSTINPDTGIEWTVDDINGTSASPLQRFGYRFNAGAFGYSVFCSQCYLIIEYDVVKRTLTGIVSNFVGAISRFFHGSRTIAGGLYASGILTPLTYEVRDMYEMGDYLYTIVGNKLYMVGKDWSKTLIGTIGTTSGKAWIKGDGTNLCVVDGVKGYSWDGITFAEITFPDTFAPSCLTFQDGYYIVGRDGTGRFYISSLNDPTTWNALDYATAEGDHDPLIVAHSYNRDLWLFGSRSLEIWYNSGLTDMPFQRHNGGFINVGSSGARCAVVSTGYGVIWLDNNLQTRLGQGIQSTIISTPQIEYQMVEATKLPFGQVENAVGLTYVQKGHTFYQLSIGNRTFVYDLSTQFWHTRNSGTDNRRHPAQCYAYFNKKHLVGHYTRGHILELDHTKFTNNGENFTAIRAAQAIHADRKRIFHKQLEIEFESGVGVDESTEAHASLDWSDDGGKTWSTPRSVSFGALGQYTTRAVWRRLGKSRSRIYRVTIDDPVKRIIIGAHLEAEVAGR